MAKYLHIQALDIETTGDDVTSSTTKKGNDDLFAIGAAVLRIDIETRESRLIESRRWVLEINPGAERDWAELWAQRQYDSVCWQEFWSENTKVLASLMRDTPPTDRYRTEAAMADSFNAYLDETEKKFVGSGLKRVYDTVGFDAGILTEMLGRHGHKGVYLSRPPNVRPCQASYLTDVRNHALGVSPLAGPTEAQKAWRRHTDKVALPEGVVHNHDPACNAQSIAWKWVFYAAVAHIKKANANVHCTTAKEAGSAQ